MRELESNLRNIFLLIRPYSLTAIIAIAILTNVFVEQPLKFNTILLKSILISILIWVSTVFLLEFMHKHTDNRKRIPDIILCGTIGIVVFLLSSYVTALLLFGVILLCVFVYSLKAKNWLFSPFVFVFRGFVETGVILIILVLNNMPPLSQNYLDKLLLPIFFVTISRNLVGDIRDIERDKYTFPKKFGETATYLKKTNGHSTHFMYIICTLFFLVNYIAVLTKSDLTTNFLLFIGVLFWMTYNEVPRSVNKNLTSI
jgi:hypothetical protein